MASHLQSVALFALPREIDHPIDSKYAGGALDQDFVSVGSLRIREGRGWNITFRRLNTLLVFAHFLKLYHNIVCSGRSPTTMPSKDKSSVPIVTSTSRTSESNENVTTNLDLPEHERKQSTQLDKIKQEDNKSEDVKSGLPDVSPLYKFLLVAVPVLPLRVACTPLNLRYLNMQRERAL